MNWSNRLSILRVLCIPVIILLMSLPGNAAKWAAVTVFALASLTDYLDGHLARKNGWITDFGKFIDPVADKLLVLSTLIMLVQFGTVPGWMVVLILARELSVDGLRLVAMTKGEVIAAGKLGKIKTFSQMILILLALVLRRPVFTFVPTMILSVWVGVITLWSGVDYFRRNWNLLE